MPEDYFRLIIAGPSGSGKTKTLRVIYNLLYFDEILLFAKNLYQDKYQLILSDFAKRIDPEVGYKVVQTPTKIIPLYKAFQRMNLKNWSYLMTLSARRIKTKLSITSSMQDI